MIHKDIWVNQKCAMISKYNLFTFRETFVVFSFHSLLSFLDSSQSLEQIRKKTVEKTSCFLHEVKRMPQVLFGYHIERKQRIKREYFMTHLFMFCITFPTVLLLFVVIERDTLSKNILFSFWRQIIFLLVSFLSVVLCLVSNSRSDSFSREEDDLMEHLFVILKVM